MKKIMISLDGDCASFSVCDIKIDKQDLNNTNVVDVKNLKFTDRYMLDNMDLITSFLKFLFVKFNISKVKIEKLEIAETVLLVINNIELINEIEFLQDDELTYSISSLLLQNKNLEKIKCYNIPSALFYKFYDNQIETRNKFLAISNFVKENRLNTRSNVFYKTSVIIGESLTQADIDDIITFLNYNKSLKRIEFEKYNKEDLEGVLTYIKKNQLKKITIIINEEKSDTNCLLTEVKNFNKLSKEYDVNIKIKYSKEYKRKYRFKELNLLMLRNIVIVIILLTLMVMIVYKIIEIRDNKSIEDNIEDVNEKINQIVNENNSNDNVLIEQEDLNAEENNYISPYYKKYSKVYNELLTLNTDTVGWLTVNNTKINYPVVQSLDNDYYLNHAYDHSNNVGGWVFVDYRCNMQDIDKHTIIYGHNIKNSNLMFSTLHKVLDESWYSNLNNLIINFSIKEKEYTWKIFSIYKIEKTSDYLYTNFNTDDDYLNFLQKLKNRSISDFKEELTNQDKILTLSTCYKDDSHRVVVHAKLIQ